MEDTQGEHYTAGMSTQKDTMIPLIKTARHGLVTLSEQKGNFGRRCKVMPLPLRSGLRKRFAGECSCESVLRPWDSPRCSQVC